MANNWKDGSDNWNTPADWSGGTTPGSSDDVTVAQGDPQITTNVGTVNSVTNSSEIDLVNGGMLATTAGFTNSGTVKLDDTNYGNGGSSLTIGGTLTNGTLNTGGTVDIGNTGLSATTIVSVAGFANAQTGTINIAGNTATLAELNITGAAGFGQGAGVLSGTVNLTNDALVQFGSGQITSITANSQLYLNGANAFVADAGATTSNSALVGLATNAGTLDLLNGASITTTVGLTNSGTINVDDSGYGNGGSSLTVGGKLANSGTLNIGNTGLSAPTTVTAASLTNFVNTNTGTINLAGSSTNQAELDVTGAAGFGSTGIVSGTVNLTNDSLIQFASGQITGITANSQLYLNGANAFVADAGATTSNSALAGLATNAGTFDLRDGATVTTTVGLTNSGTINVDDYGYGDGGSSLTIGGKLTNSGTLDIGNTGLSAPTTVTAASLTNFVNITSGTINLAGSSTNQAELDVTSAASFGRSGGLLVGSVNLTNDALLQFASGQITSITGASQLYLDGTNAFVADAGATTSNSALQGLTSNAGTFDLRDGASVTTTAGLNNSGTINVDDYGYGDGGSTLTLGGALTNGGTFNIGNTGLSAATTVTTTGVANTGTINLAGSTINPETLTANLAELDVTGGVAGFGTAGEVTGQVNLTNDALVQFQSGQITTITGGSQLYLDGSDAYVADASDPTSNSALTGLTTNAGTFDLRDGATVTTTSDLTNSGTINVDDYGYGDGGSTLTIGGALTNGGTFNVGNGGLSAATTVTVNSLANTGTINVSGGAISTQTGIANEALLTVNGAAGFGTAGTVVGNVNLYQDGQIEFASGQITTIASGSELTLNGADAAIANDGTDTNSALTGLTTVAGNLSLSNGATVATGAATAVANTLTVGNLLTDTGSISTPNLDIAAGGTLDIGTGGSVSSAITFAGTSSGEATLTLDATPNSGSTFGNTLTNFGDGDALDLKGLAFASGATATYSNGTLTVTSNGVSESFTLSNPGATTFYVHQDSGTGTLVTDSPAVCFASGTRIRTARGEVAVEELAAGDHVVTASGAARPIRWLGHRTMRPRSHPRPHEVQPIRIAAHAFGESRPSRDLVVSPGHAICVDVMGEALVPAGALVDGVSVSQLDVDAVTYWHVELDSHDILLAENLGAESYLDMGNRDFFGTADAVALHGSPDAPIATHADFCRPFHASGTVVAAVRARLCARAARLPRGRHAKAAA